MEEFSHEVIVVAPGEDQAMKIVTAKDPMVAETMSAAGYRS
ncbi:hypothetical protein [Pseudactinotalea sp. HY160]|nr:hypothetical protein [Pseudactinotalea sp. HY160]